MPSSHIEDRWYTKDANGERVPSSRYQKERRWRLRYRIAPGGKQYIESFDRKIDAEQRRNEIVTSLNTGLYVSPERGRTKFSELAEAWHASNPNWTESTRARNRSVLDNHVLPSWGNVRVMDITHESITDWVKSLRGAAGTVRKAHGVFASVLDLAVARQCLAVNPARNAVKLPKQKVAARRYLSAEQVESLAEASGDNAIIVLVLAYCGLRIGELAGVRCADVDVKRRRIMIERSVTEVNGKLAWSPPKDDERRSVPVPKSIMKLLKPHLEGLDPSDQVFTSPQGDVLRVRNMRRGWFDAAATKAGFKGLVPHELRHTAASMAISAGASVLTVQRMLGHSKPSITLDTYSDLFDDDLDAVATKMDRKRSKLLRSN